MSESGKGKVAIVTGGSRGIGRGVAEALLGEGWKVWICSRRPESIEQALGELGERADGRAVDVRRQEEVEAFVGEVAEREGRIDLLVNNAGLAHFGAVDELTGEQWREVLET